MATNPLITKNITMPDMTDRYPPVGNPPDGYVVTYSAIDGYYLARPQPRLLNITTTGTTPYNVGSEDLTLVSHGGAFVVNLPISPPTGTSIFIKDFTGNASAFNITVNSAQLIDGATPYIINTNFGLLRAVFTGATWVILDRF